MLAKIYSAAVYEADAYEIEIGVNSAGGEPCIVRSGSPFACSAGILDRTARVRISLVDILPAGFGDANVATEHNQSNRRNRCRQSKDEPHRPGMSRTVFW